MIKREIALELAKNFINLPYKWGGNDPREGFDCSGLIVEILQSVGIVGEKEDYTANGLAYKFEDTDVLEPGNLVFWDWNNDGKIDHVEMIALVDDSGEIFTLGASGGSSATTTPQDSSNQNAYVKIRPMREGYKSVVDPFASSS